MTIAIQSIEATGLATELATFTLKTGWRNFDLPMFESSASVTITAGDVVLLQFLVARELDKSERRMFCLLMSGQLTDQTRRPLFGVAKSGVIGINGSIGTSDL